MGRSLRVGKLFGIPIYLHFSWFIVLAYLIVVIAAPSGLFSGFSAQMRLVGATATGLVFFACILLHELAHSLIAIRTGIPVKSITLFIFGGVAQITRESIRPRDDLQMALAGPLCSMTLCGLLVGIWFIAPANLRPYISIPVAWLAVMNMIVALFNLLPAFPLDGGRVMRALIWRSTKDYRRSTQVASWSGRTIGYLFMLVGLGSLFTSQLRPAPAFAEFLGLYGGLWLAFIGWILETAASSSYRRVEKRLAFESRTVAEAMVTAFPFNTPPSFNLLQLVTSYGSSVLFHDLPVVEHGKLQGVVTLSRIKAIPQQQWETTSVAAVMTPPGDVMVARPGESVATALQRMEDRALAQLLVIDGEAVVGILTRDSLLHLQQACS